jgi:hypothetical protein
VVSVNQSPGRLEHLGEVGPTEVGHAQDAKSGCGIVVDRIHRHDVRVLQPRQRLWLVAVGPRDFDGHQALAQADLLGQVHTRERATTELEDYPKAAKLIPGPRETDSGASGARTRLEVREGLAAGDAIIRRFVARESGVLRGARERTSCGGGRLRRRADGRSPEQDVRRRSRPRL